MGLQGRVCLLFIVILNLVHTRHVSSRSGDIVIILEHNTFQLLSSQFVHTESPFPIKKSYSHYEFSPEETKAFQ
jgi:hypothetical protein